MAIVYIQADCLAAHPPDGCDTNVKPIVLKRIETWCASYRQHTLPHVGWLREASRQTPHRGKNWPLCVSRRIAWRICC
nr:hypothetical protein [Methylomarinum sp. Ch1-1]MDP4520461.1 hypothetical protein [Methylomarinum sp. Ch1-1]